MSALHETLDDFEIRALELGITPEEIRLAQEVGLTLEEWHRLKNYNRNTHGRIGSHETPAK